MTLCNTREAPGQAAGSHFPGHTTASLHQCPRTPLTVKDMGVALASGYTPASPKITHWLCWGMENVHLPSAPDTGDTARLGGSQGHPAVLLCGANPSRNTLLIHLHRSRGTAKEEKLSGARRCLHMGRETNSEHRAR